MRAYRFARAAAVLAWPALSAAAPGAGGAGAALGLLIGLGALQRRRRGSRRP